MNRFNEGEKVIKKTDTSIKGTVCDYHWVTCAEPRDAGIVYAVRWNNGNITSEPQEKLQKPKSYHK